MLSQKGNLRKRRRVRIRAKIHGTKARPRFSVFRSLNHIYAQLIDDDSGAILASYSSLKLKKGKPVDLAKEVGKNIAAAAKTKKVKECVFDRGGYKYHGRVKALADAAREGGLEF